MSELLALEGHWRDLTAKLPQTRFIHTFDWQRAYLGHLESNPEATCYVSFFHNARAIAIFPLRRVRRVVGRVPLRLWELPTHAHMGLCDALISPEWNTTDLIHQLIRALDLQSEYPWDALHLPRLLDDAVAVRALRGDPPPGTRLDQSGTSMYFRCPDMHTALVNCSNRFKRNLRRQRNKLAKRGALTLTLAREGVELDAAFAEFLSLEASGWKGPQGKASAIGLHSHLIGFYGELKNRFAASGACLVPLLKLDGVTIAAQFCLLSGNTLYIQKIAYDETWRAVAPGFQLLREVLEYCCTHPKIDELSLVTGPAWAAERWNPERHAVWDAYFFNTSPRALVAQTVHGFKVRILEPARGLLQRHGQTW